MVEDNNINTPASDSERDRYTMLINSMIDGVISLDANIRVETFNAAALNILDINNLKKGDLISDFFKPIDQYNQIIDIEKVIKDATVPYSSRDFSLKLKGEHIISVFFSVTPVKLGFGSTSEGGYVLLIRDITKEVSLEKEKNEFVSVVSHELRTPIAVAEGNISNAQFMSDKFNADDSIKKSLTEAHNQINYLADLINDLSTLSRAETGKLKVEVTQFNVTNLVNDLMKSYLPQAQQKHLNLTAEIDPTLELLSSSELYVKEILQNMITNAIKYTEKGYIVLRAKKTGLGVWFEVQDSGIGISKEDQTAVYDKFFRSADYRTRKTNGTGLGLYVTMKLAKILNAEIDLSSELNVGTTFRLYVPNLAITLENK